MGVLKRTLGMYTVTALAAALVLALMGVVSADDEPVERLPRNQQGRPVIDRPLGDDYKAPTPAEVRERRRRLEAEQQRRFDEEMDGFWRNYHNEQSLHDARRRNEQTLQDGWRQSGSDLSFDNWVDARLEEQRQRSWHDDFEEWGDEDSDGTPEQARQSAMARLAAAMREEAALRQEYAESGSDLPFEDWVEQQEESGWSDDFEEWGDEDWDDLPPGAGTENSPPTSSEPPQEDPGVTSQDIYDRILEDLNEALELAEEGDLPPGTSTPQTQRDLPPGAIPANDMEAAKRAICNGQPSAEARAKCLEQMGLQ